MGEVQNGNRTVNSFIVSRRSRAKQHRPRHSRDLGLTDWVRSVAINWPQAGYIAIAPTSFQAGADGGGSSAFADRSAVAQAIRDLPSDQITADLKAVADT